MAANIIVIGALITYYVLMSKENFWIENSWDIDAHFLSFFLKSNKFLFGAGISIYKMQAVDNTTAIKPFVDDVNCIGSILNLACLLDGSSASIWLGESVI